MLDNNSPGLPGEEPFLTSSPRPAQQGLVARCALALVAGGAVVWAFLLATGLGLRALFGQGGPWAWTAVLLNLVVGLAAYVLGGVGARLAGRTNWGPGWLGLGAAWLFAAASVASLPSQVTSPLGFSAVPEGDRTIVRFDVPNWLLAATVYAALSYWGDRLACRMLYGREPRDAG